MTFQPDTPVTLATIAAQLGVSRSTVSNAYNHPDQLSPTLRKRIFEAAEQLGYTGPDPVARRLRKGRAGAIGVLFSEPLHHAFADAASQLFLEGVARAGESADSAMLLIPATPSKESAEIVTNAVVDGFVLYSIPPTHPFVEAAVRRRLPIVCVDQTKIGGTSWIGINDRKAAAEAAQHLLDLGHKRFAILVYGLDEDERSATSSGIDGGESDASTVSWLRIEGYGDALRSAGIDMDKVAIYQCSRNTRAEGAAATKKLLSDSSAPTAVLCTSDELAIGFMTAAEESGKSVPNDVSVIGFNDVPAADAAGLTTMRQPLFDKGEQAARILLEPNQERPAATNLEASLVLRSSTGKVRS